MPTAGGTAAHRRLRLLPVPHWLREFVVVAVIYVGYEASRGLRTVTLRTASGNGWDILRWERSWDIAPEHLLTHALITVTPIAVVAAYFYSTMHYVITPVVLVWMYHCHGSHYRTARRALAISTIIGLAVFYLVPTAPPRLLAGAGVPDALFDVRNWGWWGGEGSVPRGLGSITNQFAAMPSLHVGWAIWCGFLLFRYSSRAYVRWLGVAYPLVTTLVVLSTGNHYLLDAVAGGLVMAVGAGFALGWKAVAHRARTAWTAHRSTARATLAAPARGAVPARGAAPAVEQLNPWTPPEQLSRVGSQPSDARR